MLNKFSITSKSAQKPHRKLFSSFKEHRPQSTTQDKESISYENMQLKSRLNQLEEDYHCLSVKYYNLEREFKQGTINDAKSSFIHKLKQQHKQYESDLLDKLRLIEQMRRDVRYTRYQELEIELANYQKETLRLKKQNQQLQFMLNSKDSVKSIEDLYVIQDQTIKKLYKDNHELIASNSEHQQQSRQLKSSIEKYELQQLLKEKEISSIKKQLNLSTIIPSAQVAKTRQQIYKEATETANQLHNLEQEVKELQKQLEDKDIQILQLVETIKRKEELIKDYENLPVVATQAQSTIEQQATLDQKVGDSVRQIKQQPMLQSQPVEQVRSIPKLTKKQSQLYEQSIKSRENASNYKESVDQLDEFEYLTVQPIEMDASVNFYDVENIGKQLRYQFLEQNTPYEEVEACFDDYSEDQLSISELLLIFQGDPFRMKNAEQRLLLARYLVEDNSEDYINFDVHQHNDLEIIKSVFRKLVGKFELFSEQEKGILNSELTKVFSKIGNMLIDTIQQIVLKKKHLRVGTCEQCDYEQAIQFCEVSLSRRQQEYIQLICYVYNGVQPIVDYNALKLQFF